MAFSLLQADDSARQHAALHSSTTDLECMHPDTVWAASAELLSAKATVVCLGSATKHALVVKLTKASGNGTDVTTCVARWSCASQGSTSRCKCGIPELCEAQHEVAHVRESASCRPTQQRPEQGWACHHHLRASSRVLACLLRCCRFHR